MIVSYLPIHHDEEYEGQHDYETARADQVRTVAEAHGVGVHDKPDGDTTYVESHLTLESVAKADTDGSLLEDGDYDLWEAYAWFLTDLERSNLGYLVHEVDYRAEQELLEELPLRYVEVERRELV